MRNNSSRQQNGSSSNHEGFGRALGGFFAGTIANALGFNAQNNGRNRGGWR